MKSIHVFTYQPCEPVAPFEPLSVPREVGFYEGDDIQTGRYVGLIHKSRDSEWMFQQQAVGMQARLTAKNLRTIADKLTNLNAKAHTENQATREEEGCPPR